MTSLTLRTLASFLLVPGLVSAASLQQITKFATNPTNVGFYIYVPDKLASKPPILLVPHACHGKAQDACTGTKYATPANTYGNIVIYPDSPSTSDKCWDVSSTQSLTRNGSDNAHGIVSMIQWTLSNYAGDASRVFVTAAYPGDSGLGRRCRCSMGLRTRRCIRRICRRR
ncbi:uncharacterized protein BDZ99DRAFT_140399 [Mytilinidion resinicola]|uniref:Uncharacterized protein n=1 Tax=Mytilinidion resinicola TaxID=574789 RepID=A0A6A6Z8L2_9PEZI|nr:uncharacterized protein BDZ99DRAFT_140399 [Mytilinidion resinicola]KAF2816625.1 hypothetical protein BDZ99DRAFT_140399 [Mytilinidion resinicola]